MLLSQARLPHQDAKVSQNEIMELHITVEQQEQQLARLRQHAQSSNDEMRAFQDKHMKIDHQQASLPPTLQHAHLRYCHGGHGGRDG